MRSTMLTLDKKIKLDSKYRFQWEKAQQRYVLLFSEGMVELNDTSAEILQRCDGRSTGEAIIQSFEAEYPDVSIRDDLIEFFKEAERYGWLINVE